MRMGETMSADGTGYPGGSVGGPPPRLPAPGFTVPPAPAAPTVPQAPYGAVPAYAPVPPRRSHRRAIKAWLWTIGILVVLGVGGYCALWFVNVNYYGPEGTVRQYLSALQDGRASDAIAAGRIELPADDSFSRTLLSDEAYQQATDRPSDIEIVRVERDDAGTRVVASYTIGGAQKEQTFAVEQDGREYLIFDRWRLSAQSLANLRVQVEPRGGSVAIAGQGFDLEAAAKAASATFSSTATTSGSSSTYGSYSSGPSTSGTASGDALPQGLVTLPALPGTYSVDITPVASVWEVENATVSVGFDDDPGATAAQATARLSDSFFETVQQQARDVVDSCATRWVEASCPFETDLLTDTDYVNVQITVNEKLELNDSRISEYDLATKRASNFMISGGDVEEAGAYADSDYSGTPTRTQSLDRNGWKVTLGDDGQPTVSWERTASSTLW